MTVPPGRNAAMNIPARRNAAMNIPERRKAAINEPAGSKAGTNNPDHHDAAKNKPARQESALAFPERRLRWRPCYRLIPSRFPPINLFERVADPAELEAVIAIESLTNDRLRAEIGDITLIPPEDRVSGPGSSYILAAFTHPNPMGSRFSDGSYGVYYAGRKLVTAVAETRHHRERFLAATNEGPIEVEMRVILADMDGKLRDIRGIAQALPGVYDPDHYGAAQNLARQLRGQGAGGIAYDSVRDPGGECIAIFRPPLLANARQERHLAYCWDGTRISQIYEKRLLDL